MGLSVLVPEDAAQLQVEITWGDYTPHAHEDEALEAEPDEEKSLNFQKNKISHPN